MHSKIAATLEPPPPLHIVINSFLQERNKKDFWKILADLGI